MNLQQTLPGGKPLCSCFLVLFLLSTIFLPGSAQCNPANKHVLIVHSYHQEFPWTDSIMAGMMEVLHREHPKADIHVEYLDAKRLTPDRTSKAFKELLRLKFEKKSPDVIVVSDDAAFHTILALRPSLFPDVPLVFCGVNELTDAMIAGMTGITGVVEDFDLRGTLEIALHLHPRSKHVAVISDSTETGRINLERYRQVRPAFADRFESIELAEMSAEELTGRLGQLPNDTVLLLLSFYRDRNGRSFSVPDMMHLIAQASDLPIYVAWDYMLIPRALGGRVVSGRQQGESAARMAALILQGTPVASLPIQRVSPNIPMFDQIELTRFGIDSARLPKGSVVINAPPSLPSRYLWFIAGFSVLVLAEGLLILALIRNTRRYKTSQEDLRQSEERFALAMQAASDGIFDWDLKTNRVYYSPAWKHMLGYRDDELENDFSVWERLTEPDDLVRAWALQRELLAGKRDRFDMEFRMRHKEGHWVDILARATTIFAADGTPAREVGTHVDITERKQAEKALAANERKYRDLFEANQDGISLFRINPDGTPAPFLDVNEAAAAMVGYSKHELAGMTPMDVEPAVSPESIAQRLATLAATGQARFETVLVAKDRREISVEVLVRSIVYEGAPTLMNIVRDINERKQFEAALLESEARIRAITESANDAIVMMDQTGQVSYWNPAAERIFGYKAEEMLGKNLHHIIAPKPYHNAFNAAFPQFQQTGEGAALNAPLELQAWHKNGHEFSVELSLSTIHHQDGLHTVGIVRDITERKQAEKERKQLQTQLVQAQKMEAIGTLAGGIAHDFNNILGAILGYTEIAIDSIAPDSIAVNYLNKVMEASRRAAGLVKQILAFSRQTDTERIVLQPALIVKEVIKLLRPSLPSTIVINQQVDPATKSILADPTQVHQILMNLCTNAYHAMELTGGILEITLKNYELSLQDLQHQSGAQPNGFVQLSISDSGQGIAPEIRDKIFEPYFTTKEVGKGTGMGLAIVHGIVSGYGGFITCESTPCGGTVFHVFFPSIEEETGLLVEPVEAMRSGRGRILLVDDEEILVDMGTTMLKRLGCEVIGQTSSLEALDLFQSQPDRFDAVITDQTMPGMTGIELARRMLEIRPDLPIILCTGYSSLVTEEQAKACGIKGFAMKPLTKKEIAKHLSAVLNREEVSNA